MSIGIASGDLSLASSTDLLWELEHWKVSMRVPSNESRILGVWHAFSGDLTEAQTAWDLGLVLGLGGPVTFQNARKLHALVPELRIDKIILETDAPYLAPHPHRGQRNEPGYVPMIAQTLADLFGVLPEVIAELTTLTARRCFRCLT